MESGLLEQYVLRIATPEEEAIVEEFASNHPDIAAQVKELQTALELYAKEQSVPPPNSLKGQIMSEITKFNQKSTSGSRGFNFSHGILLAICLGLGLAAFVAFRSQKMLKNENANLHAAYNLLEENCLEQQDQAKAIAAQLEMLRAPETRHIDLSGTPNAPEAQVRVYWNQASEKGMLQVQNLPIPPKGKTYQIWADVEGEMIDAGIFDGTNSELQPIAFISNAESLNITLEPEGGSKHPTVALLQANGLVGS
ncbi:MAG: anti-sigma factor [Bacteroidetes bacterium]|nr:anti-sigma factor [Bacteroidota bacterium]